MKNLIISMSLSCVVSIASFGQNNDNRNYKIPANQKQAIGPSKIGVFRNNPDYNGSFMSVHNYKHSDLNKVISPEKIKVLKMKGNSDLESFNPHLSFRNYKAQLPVRQQNHDETLPNEVALD